jgi:hypothetical protein
MTTYYDRDFPVVKWIIATGLTEKQRELLLKATAKTKSQFIRWPALDMPAELETLAGQGYFEHVHQPKPFFLDLVLILRAMVNITRRDNAFAQISNKPSYQHLCNNRILTDDCFVRVGNEVLAANDPITLSQVFNTADRTEVIHVSIDGDKKTIQKIAKEVVTMGNDDSFDINLSNLNAKDLQIAISSAF